MPWTVERLQGTIDGSNRFFTISHSPVIETLLVIFTGIPMEIVTSQPDLMQFAFNHTGLFLELGIAPMPGQNPWCRYFYLPYAGPEDYASECAPGAYGTIGVDADLTRNILLNCAPTSYELTGSAQTLMPGYGLNCEPASHQITGIAATLHRTALLNCEPSIYNWAGQPAGLVLSTLADFYVDGTNGNDAWSGTLAAPNGQGDGPFQTISKGINALSAGETLCIRQGTYEEMIPEPPSGSLGSETRIITYGTETVTFTKNTSWNFYNRTFSYVDFIGNFVWDGTGQSDPDDIIYGGSIGFNDYESATHIRFIGIQMINWLGCGVAIGKGDKYVDFINCYFYHNGHYLDVNQQVGYHFYQKGNYVRILHCGLFDAAGYAIHQYTDTGQGSNGSNCVYAYNLIGGNGTMASTNDPAAVLLYSLSSNTQVFNNIIYQNLRGQGVRVHNGTNNHVYNNTVYANGTYNESGFPAIYINTDASGTKVKNNIAWANGYSTPPYVGIVDDGTGTELATNLETDPHMIDPPNNFYLQGDSDAIEAGVDLSAYFTDDYDGNPRVVPFDIGAIEVSG